MTEPTIDLAAIHEYLDEKAQYEDEIAVLSCAEVLALVEVAEAAHDFRDTFYSLSPTVIPVDDNLLRHHANKLDAALAKFSFASNT